MPPASKTSTVPQTKTFGPLPTTYDRKPATIEVTVRWDDTSRNGHNTFAITATIRTSPDGIVRAAGCCPAEIATAFPELVPLIKFHLAGPAGPMHYVANTTYLAGDRDHNGMRAGETRQLVNGRTRQPIWRLTVRDQDGNVVYSTDGFGQMVDADQKPEVRYTVSYEPVNIVGTGKPRELAAARSAAAWPDATDEDLTAPGLEERLAARLPALLEEFHAAVVGLGFVW
jgi:hypothetical protein